MKRSKVYLNRAQSRAVDSVAIANGISGINLMENAGKACASRLIDRDARSVVVCCGTGNNGGDGFVIARRLAIAGVAVKILVCGDPAKIQGDARVNFEIANNIELNIRSVRNDSSVTELEHELSSVGNQETNWICDCLLGTGAEGNPRKPISTAILAINRSDARVMAVDIPSGLDCETGIAAEPTVSADLTCTFVARKSGFKNPLAMKFLGEVQVVSINVPTSIIEQVLGEHSDP